MNTDTIAAVATASGKGGIGVIRVSGPLALRIANDICTASLRPREACFASFFDKDGVVDQGIVIFFPAPHSFTGEDVVEFQGHGSNIVLNQLLALIVSLGARAAKPGEFSERAFLNNKIDLLQAEAIADLIDSQSDYAARSALRSLRGTFSNKINTLIKNVTDVRVFVEAGIDFPDEEIDVASQQFIEQQISFILKSISDVINQAERGCSIKDGASAVIVGSPNVGKSSLLNYLAAEDVAIVTSTAGTTRDVLRQEIILKGRSIKFIDTAGLRSSSDEIEQEGIKKAAAHIDTADIILYLQDASANNKEINVKKDIEKKLAVFHIKPHSSSTFILVNNKIDLIDKEPSVIQKTDLIEINLSIKSEQGIQHLEVALAESLEKGTGESDFVARHRHVTSLHDAKQCIERGSHQFKTTSAYELLAEDLRHAQDNLGKITGAITSDALLGEIFSSFCIGK